MTQHNFTNEQVEKAIECMFGACEEWERGHPPRYIKDIANFLRASVKPTVKELVQEYVNRCGWPANALSVVQSKQSNLIFSKIMQTPNDGFLGFDYGKNDDLVDVIDFGAGMASDWESAIITKEDLDL